MVQICVGEGEKAYFQGSYSFKCVIIVKNAFTYIGFYFKV